MPQYTLNSTGSAVPFYGFGAGIPVVLQNLDAINTIIFGPDSSISGANINKYQTIAPGGFIALAELEQQYAQTLTGTAVLQVTPNATNASGAFLPQPFNTALSATLPNTLNQYITLIDWTDSTAGDYFESTVQLNTTTPPPSTTPGRSFVTFLLDDFNDQPIISPAGLPNAKYQWVAPIGFPLDNVASIGPLTTNVKGPLPKRYRLRAIITTNSGQGVTPGGPTIAMSGTFTETVVPHKKLFAKWADAVFPTVLDYAAFNAGLINYQRITGSEQLGFFDNLSPGIGGSTNYCVATHRGKQKWALGAGTGVGNPAHTVVHIYSTWSFNAGFTPYVVDLGPSSNLGEPTVELEVFAPSDVMIIQVQDDTSVPGSQSEVLGMVMTEGIEL